MATKKRYDFIEVVSYENIANDSLPIYESVRNSNFEPILSSFEIKTVNPEDSSIVIDVTSLFSTDIKALGFLSIEEKA